jgi:hypothetical protein
LTVGVADAGGLSHGLLAPAKGSGHCFPGGSEWLYHDRKQEQTWCLQKLNCQDLTVWGLPGVSS